MTPPRPTEPVTVRAASEIVAELDALAVAMDRSRNYVIVQALKQYLENNAWHIDRIREGAAAAAEGRVRPADDVFSGIAAKHGWSR